MGKRLHCIKTMPLIALGQVLWLEQSVVLWLPSYWGLNALVQSKVQSRWLAPRFSDLKAPSGSAYLFRQFTLWSSFYMPSKQLPLFLLVWKRKRKSKSLKLKIDIKFQFRKRKKKLLSPVLYQCRADQCQSLPVKAQLTKPYPSIMLRYVFIILLE